MSSAFLTFCRFDKPRQMWYTGTLRAYLKTVGGSPSLGESAVAISFGRRAGRIHAPGKGVIAMTLIEVLTLLSLICQIIRIMQDSNKRK